MKSFRRPALLCIVAALMLSGCDSMYRFLFYPPQKVEYTLVPDPVMLASLSDSAYTLSSDSLAIAFDVGSYKVEIKYMSDFQLNEVEFRDESKDGTFSSNPFTYANWVDPQLGYTPNRFSVFRVSILNYTAPKLNFDPERSFLVTDRGDLFNGYGREEKTSKNFSIEAYFKRRKGAGGVEDEIFERRMGIVRSTVLYLGRPIYAGDTREGFVVYDPVPEGVEQIKIVMNDFILGYDENNEPSEFRDLTFYFKRIPLDKERTLVQKVAADTSIATDMRTAQVLQLRYQDPSGRERVGQEDWNAQPNALPALSRFLRDSLRIRTSISAVDAYSPDLLTANTIFLLLGPSDPVFKEDEIGNLVNAMTNGAVIFIDNAAFATQYRQDARGDQLLTVMSDRIPGSVVVRCQPDHSIFSSWKRIGELPEGMDDRENMPSRRDYLKALMLNGKTLAIFSTKGYSMVWGKEDGLSSPQFTVGANVISLALEQLK